MGRWVFVKRSIFVAFVLVFFGFCVLSLTRKTSAVEESSWLSPASEVSIKDEGFLAPGQTPPSLFNYTGIPCTPELTEVRTITKWLGVVPVLGTENKQSCNVPTGFGSVGTYLKLDGRRGAFKNASSGSLSIKPVPFRSTIFITDGSGIFGSGARLYKQNNIYGSININDILSPDKYRITSYGDKVLLDGQQVAIEPDTISISRNSQWFVASLNSGDGLVLLSVDDKQPPIKFGPGYAFSQGYDPIVKTTVSNSGRFVAVSSYVENLSVYSTDKDCGNNCKIDLTSKLKKISSDEKIRYINFISDKELEVYLVGTFGGEEKRTKIIHIYPDEQSKNQAQDTTPRYLALGDSFSSGEGAFNYREGTDVSDNRCHQSLLAYSELASLEASISDHHSVACSGAKIQDVFFSNDDIRTKIYNNKERQSKSLESDDYTNLIYDNFLPGYRQQYEIVDHYRPNIITISISGNDLGFSDKIQTCITRFTTCYSKHSDKIQMLEEILNQQEPLKKALLTIKQNADSKANIYVLGYPRLFPNGGGSDCQLNTPFNENERMLANDLVHDINSMIKLSAGSVGATYIDMEYAMTGHELCAGTTPAFNGLTAGNDAVKLMGLGKESFHPNQFGYRLMSQQLTRQSQNFTKKNPEPASIGILSRLTGSSMGENIPSNLPILVNNSSMTADSFDLQSSRKVNIELNNTQNRLLPNTSYDAVLHSDPINLGKIHTDPEGNLKGSVTLPDDLSPGWHEIHIIGKTHDGRTVDYYKSIFVSASASATGRDCDGVVEPSGIDYDQDNVDDACDGSIGSPPSTISLDTSPTSSIQGSTNLARGSQDFLAGMGAVTSPSEVGLTPSYNSSLNNLFSGDDLPVLPIGSSYQNVLGDSSTIKNKAQLQDEKANPQVRWSTFFVPLTMLFLTLTALIALAIKSQARF